MEPSEFMRGWEAGALAVVEMVRTHEEYNAIPEFEGRPLADWLESRVDGVTRVLKGEAP